MLKHVGLYAYRREALRRLVAAPLSEYEQLEGLEQLRFLDIGLSIQAVEVSFSGAMIGIGVDSPLDLQTAIRLLSTHGEPAWM